MNDLSNTIALQHRLLPLKELEGLPAVPRRRYTDEVFYKAEIDHVFKKTWLLAGHESEFQGAGSYSSLDFPFAPVLLLRDEKSEFRAFVNACRHRGATLVREKSGCTRRLSCQYHGWTYDLCGKLVGVPDKESFPGLDMNALPLQSLRCEQWGGFIFVNFDADAEPLKDFLAPLISRFSGPIGSPLRLIDKKSFEIDCNWKIAVEAFRESYHAPLIHRNSAGLLFAGANPTFEIFRNGHGTMYVPYRSDFIEQMQWRGAVTDTTLKAMPGTDHRAYLESGVITCVFPNFFFGFQQQGFPLITKWPISVNRCRMEVSWYGADWGDAPRPAEWDTVVRDFQQVTDEDISNLAWIQQALEADGDKLIPLSTKECLLYELHVEIDRRIGAAHMPAGLAIADVLERFRQD